MLVHYAKRQMMQKGMVSQKKKEEKLSSQSEEIQR